MTEMRADREGGAEAAAKKSELVAVRLREFDGSGPLESAEAMRRALDEDGIFVVRNVLSTAEIDELRDILRRNLEGRGQRFMLGRGQFNASVKVPELSFIFSHPRIVKVIKDVLGEGNVIFTGHCDIHMNMLSGWHKDSGETVPGGYFTGPYMTSDDCRVYKVAIYLQDTGPRDSFTARLGSHRETDLSKGAEVDVRSRQGDIVVFDVRITHVGQLPDPFEKGLVRASRLVNLGDRQKQDPAWVARIKEAYWKIIGRPDRLAVFFTYGADNSFTHDFADANMRRQHRIAGEGSAVALSPALKDALEEQGVVLSGAISGQLHLDRPPKNRELPGPRTPPD